MSYPRCFRSYRVTSLDGTPDIFFFQILQSRRNPDRIRFCPPKSVSDQENSQEGENERPKQ